MQGLSLTLPSLFHFPFIAFLFLIGTRGSMSDKRFCIMHTFSFKKKKNCGDFSVYDCGYFTSMGIAWLIQLYYFITGYCVFKLISHFSGCTWIVGCFCWTGFCAWNPSDLSIPLEMDARAGSSTCPDHRTLTVSVSVHSWTLLPALKIIFCQPTYICLVFSNIRMAFPVSWMF